MCCPLSCVVPVLFMVLPALVPLVSFCSPRVIPVSLPFYGVMFVVGGEVWWCVVVCGGGTVSRSALLFCLVFAVTALLVWVCIIVE